MLINFEELKEKKQIEMKEVLDLSAREVEDALVERITKADIIVNAYIIEPTEVHVNLDVEFDVDYLDARTLAPLELKLDLQEEVLFTTNLQKAEELDIDHFEKEINIQDLIWELMVVSIPFNYSEVAATNVVTEEEFNEQKPFANIFNK